MRGTTTVRFFVPAAISTQMRALGPEGEAWLHILPDRIAVAEHDWQLSVGPAFDHRGAASWVAPAALKSGEEAVLKIGFPSVETRYEALALQAYDGKGAVKLLKSSSDGCTLLIERCLPGNDLWSVDLEHGNAVAAGMLERIWREPPARSPIQTLENLAAQWHDEIPLIASSGGYDVALAPEAVRISSVLASSQKSQVVLHGDFHPGNVLAASREPWLVIDPKPLIGEPAYDLAQWFANRLQAAIQQADPVAEIHDQVIYMARRLNLDPVRIAGWTFVKSLGWDWGPQSLEVLGNVLRRCNS